MKVYTKCSNYASETCPCILAEAGHCIVCSMCRGEDYCDCSDTLTYCIYQELKNNGGKSKDQHNIIRCEIIHEKMINEIYKHLRLKVPRHVVDLLKMPGSFVFIRKKENAYYDVPISVFLTDMENETIDLIVKIIGVKTEEFKTLEKGDNVYLRGPYHNGILGIKDLSRLKKSKAAVICKGIGFIPSLGVIKTLCRDDNEVTVYLDYGTFSEDLTQLKEQRGTQKDLSVFYDKEQLLLYDEIFKSNESIMKKLEEASCGTLTKAKHIHDELEKYYISAMDLEALDRVYNGICEEIDLRQ